MRAERRRSIGLLASAMGSMAVPTVAACGLVTQAVANTRPDALESWRGGALPALKLTDLRGMEADFGPYRGRVLILNFWATWCAPCLEEMPSLQRLHQSLAGKPAQVLGVSVGDGRMAVNRFIERTGVSFPMLMDEDKTQSRRWKASILPTTYVIDVAGRPRYRHVGALAWDEPSILAAIEKLLPRRA